MAPSEPPCPHVSPRLDGALLAPCFECRPPEGRGLAIIFHGAERNSKKSFHDTTTREELAKMREGWKRDGLVGDREPQPLDSNNRWV